MVFKAVIPAAGLGTRLFPATKEQPKEMLPIFCRGLGGHAVVKPVLEIVFEQLYAAGLSEFCFVVGRSKRVIEDHFTPDANCIKMLDSSGRNYQSAELASFYSKLGSSTLMWVNQPEPKGFGNAVLMAEPFVQNQQFLVHAGDSLIISKDMDYLKKLIATHKRLNCDAAFIVLEIDNPQHYGIVEGSLVEEGVIQVSSVVEKPESPETNLAVMAMYVFKPVIFDALRAVKAGKNGEIQLTDGIQEMINRGLKVCALKYDGRYAHLDIGSPERYWHALQLSCDGLSFNGSGH